MPNESESNMEPIVSSLQPDETRTGSFSASLAGSKKQQEESSLSPTSRLQTPATKGSPSLVYVRRKLETVHGKINASSTGDTPGHPKMGSEAGEKAEVQWEDLEVSKVGQREAVDPAQSNVELQREVSINYWTERYNRLQEYLKYLDHSGLKDYAKKYQTFSIEDLNKHAVNLEKRAIRLSLEEVECFVCGRRFEKQKALFGHMRSHPEREWRGVRPEPNRGGSWRKRKRRRKLDTEKEGERVAGRERYVLGDCKRVFGTMMTSVTNAKEIAPVATEGGGSRSVCNETAQQFAMHCGLRHRPRMQCQGKMERGKGLVVCKEEMVAKPHGRERGCLLDLNLPHPLEKEQEELGERKI